MALENFVIRDVVQYAETSPKGPSGITGIISLVKKNILPLVIIVIVSGGVGYVAVYLPSLKSGASSLVDEAAVGVIKSRVDGLDDQQARQMLEMYKAMQQSSKQSSSQQGTELSPEQRRKLKTLLKGLD